MKMSNTVTIQEPFTALRAVKTAPKVHQPRISRERMAVIVVDELETLELYLPVWEELAAAAIEANVFYEPWLLIPALRAFGAGRDWRVALIFGPDPACATGPALLCGLFPLIRERRHKGLPVSALTLWKDEFCALCTPLVRATHARETLATFLDWLRTDEAGCGLMEFRLISGEGPFHQSLVECLNAASALFVVDDRHPRAMFRPAATADDYLRAALSGRRRKELRRLAGQLADCGQVEVAELSATDEVDEWITAFLELEAEGWKGRDGGAIALDGAEREFFRAVIRNAFARERVELLALKVDGQPVAMKINLLAAPGAFAWKIAFDESYARCSPGLLLEVENIRRLHRKAQPEWMDSCAVPQHFMINRLWPGRRMIETVVISTGRAPGSLALSLLPLLRWCNRLLRGTSTAPPQSD
jgi:CelD/BcsL family acetyltransferase involved in cellulose biosynthesis